MRNRDKRVGFSEDQPSLAPRAAHATRANTGANNEPTETRGAVQDANARPVHQPWSLDLQQV